MYNTHGVSPALKSGQGVKGNGIGSCNAPKIIVLGNYHKSNHDASRVVSIGGVAPTVKENHGTVTAVVVKAKVRHEGNGNAGIGGE